MESILVWIFLGPFVFAWQLAGPIIALFIAGYIRVVFGFRIWRTLVTAFISSFLYYVVVLSAGGYLGSGMWIIQLLMAIHTSLFATFMLWIYHKWKRRSEKADQDEKPAGT
ncbi:hypothetical protein [Brevibacillus choshinensis]|uniref:Uncharacterized protein n=1 Tax=Brevibacillus choshinensis TaxID=54911 RepID=A0ABX7FMZ2_BRECH|nr:hypothetical protein [Brevibacillus choshinensis]QRG67436.1 hypothetical protein JNE38_29065 [Brevibacillus choshinensis]